MKSQTIPARFAIAMQLQKDYMTKLLQKYGLTRKQRHRIMCDIDQNKYLT